MISLPTTSNITSSLTHKIASTSICALYDHLRDTLSAESLAADESLPLNSCKRIESGRNGKDDSSGNETGRMDDDAEPLHDGHGEVDSSADVVGRDAADERIKFRRGRADPEQ